MKNTNERLSTSTGRTAQAIENGIIRVGSQNEQIIAHGSGRYQHQVAVGDGIQIATAVTGVTVAATGIATTTLTAAAQPPLSFVNASAKNIVINKIYVATVSGTPANGSWWVMKTPTQQNPAALTTLVASARNPLNGGLIDANNLLKVGLSVLLTGLDGTLVPIRPIFSLNTVTAGFGVAEAEVAGQIIVRPGELFAIMAPATGTTHVVQIAIDAAFQLVE